MASVVEECNVCKEKIKGTVISASVFKYHKECFLCHQCLCLFEDGSYLKAEADDKLYCEKDYYILFGDRCARCGEIIRETLVTALDMKWHADHFTCEDCGKPLAGTSFIKRNDRPYCKECSNRLKEKDAMILASSCGRCKKPIAADDKFLMIRGEKHHAIHYPCSTCKKILEQDFKEYHGKFYCPADYAKASAHTCYVCKAPIFGRSISALGKEFHTEHFICSKCEKPFETSSFWEHGGKPFCEQHYNEIAGARCGRCFDFSTGKAVKQLGQTWCENHFLCVGCDKDLAIPGNKFLGWDKKPICVRCYDQLPYEVRRKLGKYLEIDKKLHRKLNKT